LLKRNETELGICALQVVLPTRSLKYLYHQANYDSETLSSSLYQASISSAMHLLFAELYSLLIPDSTTEVKESMRGIQFAKTNVIHKALLSSTVALLCAECSSDAIELSFLPAR
jgi:hypothetical protein